jgi:iron(III) transport system substrate-binding protein
MHPMTNKQQILRLSIFLFFTIFVGLWLGLFLSGCKSNAPASSNNNRVVLYCSVDSVFARPLIKKLEEKTGLQIDAIFDTEATKTAGLANKIRAEKQRPRADVFWSSALLQTLLMNEEGLLEDYKSPAAQDLPTHFRGEGWAGVGVRGRIIVGQRTAGKTEPQLFDLKSQGQKLDAISNPQFGTASDWVTAYGARHGQEKTLDYFKLLKSKGVQILPGNGDVATFVAANKIKSGVTDTDDYLAQIEKSKGDFYVVPTKTENVLVPGAVSILKNSPNPENARKLFDAIVSAENEAALVKEMPGVFSLRQMNDDPNWKSGKEDFSFLKNSPVDDYSQWPKIWQDIREPLNEVLK